MAQKRHSDAVTLETVARFANLAPCTISLAINRSPEECKLSKATRQKALEAAAACGYKPSWRARALRMKRTHTIGLLFANRAPYLTGEQPKMIESISLTLLERGYHQTLIPMVGDLDKWFDVVNSDRLDGCLVVNPLSPELDAALQKAMFPSVLINLKSSTDFGRVTPDDFEGGRMATHHLIDLGHRRIAFIHSSHVDIDHFSLVDRESGYASAMREAGLGENIQVVRNQSAEQFLETLGNTASPTGVVAYEHEIALLLLHGAWRKGIKVPSQFSLVAFNDSPSFDLYNPPVTVVSLSADKLAVRGVTMLLDEIEGIQSSRQQQIVLPETLIIRESTGAPQCE